jgi:hypothetical protein
VTDRRRITHVPSAVVNHLRFREPPDRDLFARADTTEQLTVPDGQTVDGGGHTITAHDPSGGNFSGSVLTNAGSSNFGSAAFEGSMGNAPLTAPMVGMASA